MDKIYMECGQWHSKLRDNSYDGTFLGDCFHGLGTYKWGNLDIYEGTFYANSKEGYAIMSLPNNSNFEGLFIRNRPFGPGILTDSDGRQDAGFWVGQKLVRLSRPVDFIVPRLAPTVTAKIKLLQFKRLIPVAEETNDTEPELFCELSFQSPYSKLIYDPRSVFFDRLTFDANLFKDCNEIPVFRNIKELSTNDQSNETKASTSNTVAKTRSVVLPGLCLENTFLVEDDDTCTDIHGFPPDNIGILSCYTKHGHFDCFENEFLKSGFTDFGPDEESTIIMVKGIAEENIFSTHIVSWNRGELCTEIIRQIYRYRALEDKLNFKITELMSGMRTAFRKTGRKERQCLYFLKMCSLGPPQVVKELLCDSEISEELMDGRGNNGLMFAAVADQLQIIDILSDHGVDVNAFNDENMTPLNMCLLRRLATQNDIYNWETAFLPPEEKSNIRDSKVEPEELRTDASIESLDRIFGDGMSIDDEKNPEEWNQALAKKRISDFLKSDNLEHLSEITIFNCKTDLGAHECLSTVSTNEISKLPGNEDPTTDVKHKNVPKSIRRNEFERSIGTSINDRYLFNLKLKEVSKVTEKEKKGTAKDDKTKKVQVENAAKEEVPAHNINLLNAIDETIEKLLERGADPNLSDVPKPSIHLAVFTQNPRTVECLLRYGADSNLQMNKNDGLLTPLHVLVLLHPRPEYVEICEILLRYGANPEMETEPDFFIREEEKIYLNQFYGRTPLHLLTMRPDIEYGDPMGYIINLGIALAEASNKNHFFNGHSGLTLAMFFHNTRLLEAFLQARCFDPNKVVGEGLGTPLHVLVSTALQKKTPYDISIKMCDILLKAGADPELVLDSPSNMLGDCVSYGYREIETEKAERKSKQKSAGKTEKGGTRDHIRDHIRVVEYLSKKRDQMRMKINPYESLADGNSTAKTGKSKRIADSRDLGKETGNDKLSTSANKRNEGRSKSKEDKTLNEHTAQKASKKSGLGEASGKNLKGSKKSTKRVDKNDQRSNQNQRSKDEIKGQLREDSKQQSKDATSDGSQSSKEAKTPFSQVLLNALLEMFGGCTNLDVNQFALPYAVLRNGNFYYKFQSHVRVVEKEQYSLV